jgi:hypothetical protein
MPASDCFQRCNADEKYDCGPGLFCTANNDTFTTYTEPCAGDAEDPYRCACSTVPSSCPTPGPNEWVCARDGQTYASLCEAHRARTDILATYYQEDCTPPADDLYQCGGIFCRRDLETCVITGGEDDHARNHYHCAGAGGAGGDGGAGAGGHP